MDVLYMNLWLKGKGLPDMFFSQGRLDIDKLCYTKIITPLQFVRTSLLR